MKPPSDSSLLLKTTVSFLVVCALVQQAWRVHRFYRAPNPLVASATGTTESLVELSPLWRNISPRVDPVVEGFKASSTVRTAEWPYEFLRFDGLPSTRVRIPDTTLDTADGFSALIWFRVPDFKVQQGQLFDSRSSNWNSPLRITQRGPVISCEIETLASASIYGAATPVGAVKAGRWHFVGCALDRTRQVLSLVLDGALVAQRTLSLLGDAKSASLALGASLTAEANESFRGDIAYFKLVKGAPVLEKIQQTFSSTGKPKPNAHNKVPAFRVSRAPGQRSMAN